MDTTLWRRNLRLFVAYRAGMSTLIYIPISLPFYQSIGFDLAEIGVLYAVNGVAMLLFDIPTGFISDRIGYRKMLIVGLVIQAACFAMLAACCWQWLVYVLQFVLGFGQAVARGADGPLARMSAEKTGAPFDVYARWGVAVMGIAEGAASLGTAVLAWQLSGSAPRIAVAIQAVVYLALLYVPWRMYEERRIARDRVSGSMIVILRSRFRAMFDTVRDEMRSNIEVRWLVLYGAVIGCTTQTVVNLVQPYFQEIELEMWQFALLWAGYHWLWAVFSLMSGWYERMLGRWGALASLVIWGIAVNTAMVLLGGIWGIIAMTVFYFIRGIQMPIILDYMTGIVREDRRATLLAVLGSIQFAMYSMMNIVLGMVAEHFSVRAAFGVSLVVYATLGLWCIVRLRRTLV